MSKMSKRIMATFTVLLMLVSMLSTFTVVAHGETSTDAAAATDYSDYTLISTAQEFDNIRNDPSGKYLLTADITLSSGFSPFSDFSGILDGGSHSVSGVNIIINSSSDVTAALFTKASGTIKNLSVYGSVKVTTSATAYVGGIVGSGDAVLSNCYNYCNVTVNAKNAYVGGIASSASTVSGCYNAGNVNVTASDYSIAAGISADASAVSMCYNTGAVTSTDDACGISAYGNIIDCYNAGVVSAGGFASGISFDDSVESCYNIAFINGTAGGYGISQDASVVNSYYVKYAASGNGNALERDAFDDASSFAGFDFDSVWTMSDDSAYPFPVLSGVPNVAAVSGGKNNGSPFEPFLITNKAEFEAISNYKGGYFRLENDIDLGEFTPIDNFEGYLYGNGKALTVNITSDGKYVGVFSKNSGVITSLGVSGSVVSTADDAYVGGICGDSSGEIYGSYNNASVSAAEGSYVGGIAGKGSDVSLCHNTGDMNGGEVAGGITGNGYVENSYNTGDVTSNNYAGGIVGVGSASKCYSLGKVNGKNVGGIAGKCNESDAVADCYYLNEVDSNGYGTACAPSAFYEIDTYAGFDFTTTWKMSTDSAYPFPVHSNVNNTAEFTDESSDFAGGNGSVFAPFLIENAAQFDNIRNYPKAYFKLTCDITMSDDGFAPIDNFEGVLDGDGFAIINVHINTTGNGALFNVNNGTIKNLGIKGCVVTVSGEDRVIGAPLTAKNLGTISNCYAEGTVTVNSTVPAFASGFVGENGGSIENCFSAVTVNSNYYAAGFATYNTGDIANCYSVSTLNSDENLGIGGFALSSSGSITGGYAITSKNDNGVGTSKSLDEMKLEATYSTFDFSNAWQMSDDANYPFPVLKAVASDIDVTANSNTTEFGGGNGSAASPYVVSDASHFVNVSKYPSAYFVQTADIDLSAAEYTPVSEFYGVYDGAGKNISNVKIITQNGTVGLFGKNYGVISGINLVNAYINVNSADELIYVGGIVGHNYSGSVSGCTVSVDIKAVGAYNAYVGGIVGHNYGKEISGCEFDGTVDVKASGTAYTGGIAGYSKTAVSGTVSGAVATADTTANYLGGLVGICDSSVSGENYALVYSSNGGGHIGGVVGKISDSGDDITSTVMINHGSVVSLDTSADIVMGGIVGYTTEAVNTAYNTGAVSSASDKSIVGGIAGINGGNIDNAFNTATLSGNTVGGLVGQNSGAVATSYSLTHDDGDSYGTYTNCLFGSNCTTSQSAYAGFDFSHVWTMSGSAVYSYPELIGFDVENTPSQITVDGLKTEYPYGDTEKADATVAVTYKFGGNETVTSNNYNLIGIDSYQIGEQEVVVAYGGVIAGNQIVTVLCPHEYDADCDDECNICHEIREAGSHSYQATYDEVNHFYKCKYCGITFGEKAHVFDNDCDTSCSGCKFVRETTHSYESSYDDTTHHNLCTICGDTTDSEEHYFDNECDTTCNGCEYTRTTSHSYQPLYDEVNHFYQCKYCGAVIGEKAHVFDNDCDTSCSGCKYVRVTTHSYETLYDDTTHYDTCTVCGDTTDSEAHYFDNECDTTCNGCDYTRTTSHSYQPAYDEVNHFYKCKYCGVTFGEKAHVFDNDCDTACSGCKYVREITHSYETNYDDTTHYDTCTVCGDTTDSEAHYFDNECDTTCNGCDYTRTTSHSYQPAYDEVNHFYQCKYCGLTFGEKAHTYDDVCDASCNGTGCKYVREPIHAWSEWIYNEDATEDADGTETRTCSACGETETQTKVGSKLPEGWDDPTFRPDEHMPFLTLNEAGNGMVLDHNKSWATRVYWGNIGDEYFEYKWFDDDLRLPAGTDYFADYAPQPGETYSFTKPGWYRFIVKGIRTGTSTEDYTYSELLFEYYYDGTAEPTVPTVTEIGNNQVRIDINETAIKKFYYGNIGDTNVPYSWFNSFWNTALQTKTYTSVFDNRDSRIITLQTKGYYNIIIVDTNNNEYIYTVYADDNAPVIKKVDGAAQAIVDIDILKGNVGTKATLTKLYYGYLGTEDVEISTWDEFTANIPNRVGASSVAQGTTYNLGNKGYYKFYAIMALSNGRTIEVVYTVDNN